MLKGFSGLIAAAAAAVALIPAAGASAGDGACCVCQQKVCHLEVGQEEVEVDCFEVECEDVCIPPVRFWWECGPIRRCGKVRTVNKLTTDSHTTTECTYDWSVRTICRRCYRKVHRLRCQQLGLGPDATPEQVGLPAPTPPNGRGMEESVRFRVPRPVRASDASFGPEDSDGGMLADDLPVRVAEIPAYE